MKWVLIGVLTLAVVLALAAFIGSRLAQAHRVSIARAFPVAPDVVWSSITVVEVFPSGRAGVARVGRLPDRNGPPVWIEGGGWEKMALGVDRREPPRLLVGRIADP